MQLKPVLQYLRLNSHCENVNINDELIIATLHSAATWLRGQRGIYSHCKDIRWKFYSQTTGEREVRASYVSFHRTSLSGKFNLTTGQCQVRA